MELALETYRKSPADDCSEEIGRTKISIDPAEYRALERLEEALKDSGQPEMLVALDKLGLDIDAPEAHENLHETKLRVFLDAQSQAGLFHVVAKSAADGSLIYTEPAMVRLVAL